MKSSVPARCAIHREMAAFGDGLRASLTMLVSRRYRAVKARPSVPSSGRGGASDSSPPGATPARRAIPLRVRRACPREDPEVTHAADECHHPVPTANGPAGGPAPGPLAEPRPRTARSLTEPVVRDEHVTP